MNHAIPNVETLRNKTKEVALAYMENEYPAFVTSILCRAEDAADKGFPSIVVRIPRVILINDVLLERLWWDFKHEGYGLVIDHEGGLLTLSWHWQ